MTDVDVYLWRGNQGHNQLDFQFVSQDASKPLLIQEFFAPHDGTMERFRARVFFNDNPAIVNIEFLKNNVVQRLIGPIISTQTGLFLPALQLPMSFKKNDLLVMKIIGPTGVPDFIRMELNCNLKFIPDVIPPGGIPLEAAIVLQLITTGSSGTLIHQFSHYTKRPLDVASSTIGAALKGRAITHIRMKVGTQVNDHGIYLAIYEGEETTTATLRAVTNTFNQLTMSPGQVYDVPLTTPYIIGTDVVDEIFICTAVVGGFNGVEFAADETNATRLRLVYSVPNGFPPDFPISFGGGDDLAGDSPNQRLINEDTIPGGILPIP